MRFIDRYAYGKSEGYVYVMLVTNIKNNKK